MYQLNYLNTTAFDFPTGYKRCKLQKIILDFHNSNSPIATVDIPPEEYTSLKSASGSFRVAIKRMNLSILVRCIKGTIYLIKY